MRGNKLPLLGFCLALTLTVLIFYLRSGSGGSTPKPWNSSAITASYVGAQLRQLDSGNAALYLAYEVTNHTDSDYRLADGPGALVMGRLRADGSLSSQQPVRLSYPVFLPAKQHARLAIEITQPFAWPPEDNPAYIEKLREFVKQRLANVQEFVLFDQSSRTEVKLPGVWQQLQETAQASY